MKTFKEWMKNETKIYISLCKKLDEREAPASEWVREENKRGTGGPIRDVYLRICDFYKEFPWNENYENMISAIKKENEIKGYGNIEDVCGFLQVFRCSLILYDQYKLKKFRNKYKVNTLNCGIYGGFGDTEDFIFKNVRRDINANSNKFTRNELVELKLKYWEEFINAANDDY
tara:strand:- start:666 stop:1184 length:519 start_codon:yes stop_codon:yes gene_type:complete